jgi:hypothetical protein
MKKTKQTKNPFGSVIKVVPELNAQSKIQNLNKLNITGSPFHPVGGLN